jgi:hypothetical protein
MRTASSSKYHALKSSSMADFHQASQLTHVNSSKRRCYATNRIGGHDAAARDHRWPAVLRDKN